MRSTTLWACRCFQQNCYSWGGSDSWESGKLVLTTMLKTFSHLFTGPAVSERDSIAKEETGGLAEDA